MILSPAQQQVLEDWMRSKGIVWCFACGEGRWRLDGATYVKALLEEGEEDLTEGSGVVKIPVKTADTWRSSTPRRWA